MVIHPQARTTPKLRAEIKAQRDRKQVDLAKQYNVTPQTIRKWQNRDEFTDKSHRPHRLQTKLSEHQEMLVVELRKLLLLPLDDLLVIVREFIHPEATRSGIHRTLRRHGVSNLNALLRAENEEEAQPAKRKTFKDYAPGFVHVDVKYLPQMADESRRTYLFVAIDRATRWVYLEILPDKSARSAKGFLKQLIKKAPFIITKVLTDNGKEFTDRFIANGERKPTGQHPFDQVCQAEGIEHRLIKPKHPQTNGMVERFNGRISEILATTHFDASRDLQETLYQYQKIYNYHVPQKNIGHITPIQALKDWHKKQPELFKKKIYDLSGLDKQQSFASLTYAAKKRKTRKERFLEQMESCVPWSAFEAIIEPYYPKAGKRGGQPIGLSVMLRIYLMQQWFNLSDPMMEDALYEIESMRRFAGLELCEDRLPDETTILKFRHLLEKHKLTEDLFAAVSEHLHRHGLQLSKGTMVDATLIAASPSTKNKKGERDPQMHQTRKGKQWYFGMKIHVGADVNSGTAHTVTVTAANEADINQLPALLRDDDEVIFGDAGYTSDSYKRGARALGLSWKVNDKRKPKRGNLSSKQRKRNRQQSRVRARVEHLFRIIKCQFGYRQVRYRGLEKNRIQVMSLMAMANLYLQRHALAI